MAYNASQVKKNVIYDLKDSPFYSDEGEFIFYFSSEIHKNKFDRELNKKILWLNDSLSRRFHVGVDASHLAEFQLYQQIEGRGFYVIDMYGNSYINGDDVYFEVV